MGTSERRAVEGDGVREGEVRSVQKSEVERTVCVRGRWRLVMKLLLEWPEYNVCDLGEAKIILPKYFGATSSCDGRRLVRRPTQRPTAQSENMEERACPRSHIR